MKKQRKNTNIPECKNGQKKYVTNINIENIVSKNLKYKKYQNNSNNV